MVVVLAGSIVVGGAVVASASIPSAGGTIQGCYTNKNLLNGSLNTSGVLRVIDQGAGETCRSGETALSWNQTGPQGPVGPTGPQGPPGQPATKRFAVVNADGTIKNSSGVVIGPDTGRTGTGLYQVDFGNTIANCAQAITVRQSTLGLVAPLFAKGGLSSDHQVDIVIFKLDGTTADQSFDITVTC